MSSAPSRLVSRDFFVVAGGTLLFFVAFGMSLPVLPRFVVEVLGHGDAMVGLVFGAYAVAAILARPFIGGVGDRRGRRVLLVGGSIVTALGLLGHVLAGSVAVLILMRLITGAGQAAVVVAVTTLALDLAPAERRGEASSYIMVAVQLGLGLGPLAGELVLARASFDAVWVASAAGALVCLLAAVLLPTEPRAEVPIGRTRLVHPAGVRPGVILGAGALGFIGFLAFVPLYGEQLGLEQVAPLFLVASGTVALVRLAAARVPDRIGPIRGASLALTAMAVGMIVMGLWRTPTGLYTATVVMALGSALLFPSLMLAAVGAAPAHERSRVMATYTLFIDLNAAVGPAVLGMVAVVAGYGGAFLFAGLAALGALALVHLWLAPWLSGTPRRRGRLRAALQARLR